MKAREREAMRGLGEALKSTMRVQRMRPDGTVGWATPKPAPPEMHNIGTKSPKPKVNG